MTKKAFTLIEVLVAIGLFTIGILTVFSLIPLATRLSAITEKQVEASNLAQGLIDENLNAGYDNIAVADSGKINYIADSSSKFYGYQKETIASYVDANLQPTAINSGLKKVQVIIFWSDRGTEKNYTLSTLISKR